VLIVILANTIKNGFIETNYVKVKVSSESDVKGLAMDLLRNILKQMNMPIFYVPTPECFELEDGSVNSLVSTMIAKKIV
jgi:hypothetical protein